MHLCRWRRYKMAAAAGEATNKPVRSEGCMHYRFAFALAVAALALPVWAGGQQRTGQRGAGGAQQGAQGGQDRNVLARGARPLVPDDLPFDPHDLSGVWLANKYGFNATYEPPMTPEGKKKFDAQKPSYGALVGSAAAQDTRVPSGRRRSIPPAQGND